jgi:oxygen-dependent protoporphyrinogen oxidase
MAGMPPSVVVIGGGVSGLSAAHYVRQRLGADCDLTVIESGPDVGGKIRTRTLADLPVDTGPDAFLSRAPQLRSLLEELGLADDTVGPAASGAFIWSRGRLRPLPPGATFGLPERVLPLVRSGLISILGSVRAAADLVLPRTPLPADLSVEDLVRPRFGTEVYERMVEPLLGGVHAGSAAVLSAPSTVPEITAMAASGRSMILTMRRRRRAAAPPTSGPPTPPLVSLRGGLDRLTRALVTSVGPHRVRAGERALSVSVEPSGAFVVETDRGSYRADHVVLATPAYVTADLLEGLSPDVAASLRAIPYVDVASIVLAFAAADLPPLPTGTGFLVPPVERELLVGSTWLTSKWPHLVNDDVVIIRSLVGRYGDTRWIGMDDDALIAAVRDGLARMVGITAAPVETIVQRWPAAMPQYVVGHGALLERIDTSLARHPGLHLTGAAYRGVGLAGCVAQGHAVATTIAVGSPR